MLHRRPAAAAAVVVLLAARAGAQPDAAGSACQRESGKQVHGAVQKMVKCLVACDRAARKGKGSALDCLPPYGGTPHACVDAVAPKAAAAVAKKCATACPRCYGADCPAYFASLLGDARARLDGVVPFVACDDAASPDGLTAAEAKVRQKVALLLGGFVAGYGKCLVACRKGEAAGKVPGGACTAGAETDAKTVDCIIKAALKPLALVEDPALDAPECAEPVLAFSVTYLAAAVEDFDPRVYCGSPSGAFLPAALSPTRSPG